MAKFSIKKQVSNFNFEKNDLFQQFMNSNTVNQIFYKDCDSLLGSTCDICILQNFTSITPNNLAKIIETVSGGGSIIYLVENCSKIEDLITMNMKYHSHIQSELFRESFHNLNKRFVYTLLDSKHSLFLNSDLKILNSNYNMSPFEYNVRPENSAESWSNLLTKNSQNETLYKLLKICKTRSQAHGLLKLYKFITQEPEEQFASQCVYLNSARGRGKSALLGIALALFVIENRFSNIAITAPTVEQLRTTFEFLITSLKTLDYAESVHFSVKTFKPSIGVEAITDVILTKNHRQVIKFCQADEYQRFEGCDLVLIDEAAAIPLIHTKNVIKNKFAVLSSTNCGYEGTGRSLSFKLIEEIKRSNSCNLLEIRLDEPIRYSEGDPIEEWMNKFLCLNSNLMPEIIKDQKMRNQYPNVDSCQLHRLNKNLLFTNNEYSEFFLNKIIQILTSAHYKNSPNDLMSIADSKSHELFCLMPAEFDNNSPIICVLLVNYEGNIENEKFNKSQHTPGNLIPYTISQAFFEPDFQSMIGVRVVRIATNDNYQRMGYGTKCIQELECYLSRYDSKSANIHSEDALFTPISKCHPPLDVDYIGTAFGLTRDLFVFWEKHSFIPVNLSHSENEITGEYSCIMLKTLRNNHNDMSWLDQLYSEFSLVYLRKCQNIFSKLDSKIAASIVSIKEPKLDTLFIDFKLNNMMNNFILPCDLKRLKKFIEQRATISSIVDILPAISFLYFSRFIQVTLSPLQSCVLMGVGLQSKNINKLSKELDLSLKNINGILNQSLHSISQHLLDELLKSKISDVKNEFKLDMK